MAGVCCTFNDMASVCHRLPMRCSMRSNRGALTGRSTSLTSVSTCYLEPQNRARRSGRPAVPFASHNAPARRHASVGTGSVECRGVWTERDGTLVCGGAESSVPGSTRLPPMPPFFLKPEALFFIEPEIELRSLRLSCGAWHSLRLLAGSTLSGSCNLKQLA